MKTEGSREKTETLMSPPEDRPENAELRRRLDGLSRLLEVTRHLAAEIELEQLLPAIVQEVCLALDCDRASLFQYNAERDELYTTVVTDLEINEIRKPTDRGIAGYVARRRTIANVPDPSQDARWNAAVDIATGYTTRSILAAPLTSPHDGSLLGVLQLLNKNEGVFDALDEEMLEAFSQHAAVAIDRARMVTSLQQQQQVQTSLNVAREIQRGFMPSELPDVNGYDLATWWYPNEAVGGDYCDVVPLQDGRTALCVADVSGHGLGPSLIMASVRAALRALVFDHYSAQVLLERLGRLLADDLQHGRFITMVLAVLDSTENHIEFANAGHAPAFHYSASTRQVSHLESTGLPLGVIEDAQYPLGPDISIAVGDVVVLCTDGIVEAMDEQDRQFGQQRLIGMVEQLHQRPVQDLVAAVGAEVESHYDGEHPPDDLTILAARRTA